MASTTAQDPFYILRDDIKQQANEIYERYQEWKAQATHTVNFAERDWNRTRIQEALRNVEFDLDDLAETIDIVEQDRAKFNLGDAEISGRRQFIGDTKKKMSSVRTALAEYEDRLAQDARAREKLLGDAKTRQAVKVGNRYSKLDEILQEEEDELIETEEQVQKRMLNQQDEQLEGLHAPLRNLKEHAIAIGDELDVHVDLVEDLDDGVGKVRGRMVKVTKYVDKIAKMSDNGKIGMIFGLFIALVVIIMMILYLP